MKGDPAVIATLQAAIALENHLATQYLLDYESIKFMGVKKTANKLCSFYDDVRCWRKMVIKRCQFLGGDTALSVGQGTRTPDGFTAVLQNELTLEMGVVNPYEQNVQIAMRALDDTTRNMYEHLLKYHQDHVGWLEKQLRLIDGLGEKEYIAEKL